MSHRNVLTRRFLSILILNNDRSKTRGCITSVNHLHQLVYRKRYADKKQVDTQFYMTFMRISTVTLYMYILPKWIKFNSNCHASITYYYFINFFFLNSIIIWTNLFLRCSICKYINIETNYSNKKLENIDFDKSSWIIARRGSLEDQSTGKFLGFFLQRIVGRCEHSLALFLDPKEKELAHRWLSRPPSFILEGWPSTLEPSSPSSVLLLLKLTERLALSSIVLSRRCGLVCAKSSEIIDTSSSTLATWTGGEMLFLPFFLSFNPLLYTFSKRFLLSSHLRLPISCLSIRFLPFPRFDNPKERNLFSFFFSIHDSWKGNFESVYR